MTAIALPLTDAQRRLGKPRRPKKTVAEAPGNRTLSTASPLPADLASEVRRILVDALVADFKSHPTRPQRRGAGA